MRITREIDGAPAGPIMYDLCMPKTLCALTLVVSSAVGAANADGARKPKLLFIGIDGLPPDAMEVAETHALTMLRTQGAYGADAQCEDLTFSGPNWSTILHGVHRDRHNVTTNDYRNARLDQYPDLFARLEAFDPDLNTARLVTWDAIQKFQPTGADVAIYHDYESDGDNLVTQAAVDLLRGSHAEQPKNRAGSRDIDAIFLYLGDVDVAGHAHGFDPSRRLYLDAITRADRQVERVIEAMKARPSYGIESWLVIVTSDHGGSIDGQHAGGSYEKRTIPFIVWASDGSVTPQRIFPGPKNVDGVRTALTHMGVDAEAMRDLDGHAVGLVPMNRPRPALGENLIYNGDAEDDRGFDSSELDQAASGWIDPGPGGFTVIRYGASDGFPEEGSPGPEPRGNNFFCAGASEQSSMSQMIELDALVSEIETGMIHYTFSGWLGGFGPQADSLEATAIFMDKSGRRVGAASIGPVSAEEREGRTSLVPRTARGLVPPTTVRIEVQLSGARAEGVSNDGYADDLSLVLSHDEP